MAKPNIKLLKKISLPSELNTIKFISSEAKFALNTFGNYVVYIGKNIPKKDNQEFQTSVSKHELDDFILRQPYFSGMTRMPATGM